MKRLLLILAALFVSLNLYSAPADSCLKYYYHHDPTFTNRDSVMVDSCQGSPTFGVYYGKKYFSLAMRYNIIPRAYLAPADSIIEYTIDSIDTQYQAAINEFTQLRSTYGNFKFRDLVPDMPDTSATYKRAFLLIFENYIPITEVENTLKSYSSIESAFFASWFGVESYVKDLNLTKSRVEINPNPTHQSISLKNITEGVEYKIYNSYGSLLLSGSLSIDKTINVERLSPGVFVIVTKSGAERFVKE